MSPKRKGCGSCKRRITKQCLGPGAKVAFLIGWNRRKLRDGSVPARVAPGRKSHANQVDSIRRYRTAGTREGSLWLREGREPRSVGFYCLGDEAKTSLLANVLRAEIVSALSQLKWLQVTARGSLFRFEPGGFTAQKVMEQLDVGSILCGEISPRGDNHAVSLECQSVAQGTLV